MKTILVPTDFSPPAKNAGNYAAALAKETNSTLVLFHAFMLPLPVSEMPFVMISADELEKTSEDAIKKEADRIRMETGVSVEWRVRLGIPDQEIKNISEDEDVDLVVMGMRVAAGINKWIGSTANAVLRKFRKPVIVIPEKATFASLKTVVYATDFYFDMHLECFAPLLSLLRTFKCHLSILHISKEGKTLTADQNSGKTRLEAIWNNIDHSYHERENSRMAEGIRQFVEQNPADLLVLVAHEHNFLEHLFGDHLTKGLTDKTQIPLLILQDRADKH